MSRKYISPAPMKIFKDSVLEHKEKLVYLVLLSFRNRKTSQCNPSRESIAELCSLSVRTVQRVIRSLELKGYVSVKREFTERRRQKSNSYYLHVYVDHNWIVCGNPVEVGRQADQGEGVQLAQEPLKKEPIYNKVTEPDSPPIDRRGKDISNNGSSTIPIGEILVDRY